MIANNAVWNLSTKPYLKKDSEALASWLSLKGGQAYVVAIIICAQFG